MRLPIGLLGHSALVINGKIHIFGGMFSKLSSFSGYHFSRLDNADKKIQSRYYHDDVSNMVLIYQEAQSTWSRGHTLKQRRFGHSSILYAQGLYHIGGGLNYKSYSMYKIAIVLSKRPLTEYNQPSVRPLCFSL